LPRGLGLADLAGASRAEVVEFYDQPGVSGSSGFPQKEQVLEAMRHLGSSLGDGDAFVFYFAGHAAKAPRPREQLCFVRPDGSPDFLPRGDVAAHFRAHDRYGHMLSESYGLAGGNSWLQHASLVARGRLQPAEELDDDLGGSAACPQTGPGQRVGTLSSRVHEASGLAASRRNRGLYWTHNDSGGRARLFAIDAHGGHRRTVYLSGASARDWEDIAVGPGPRGGVSYIYVADVGDNHRQRSSIQIYRAPEPEVGGSAWSDLHVDAERFEVRYPDGARDCEAIFVDQGPAAAARGTSGRVYVISKHYDRASSVYWVDLPAGPARTLTFTRAGALNQGVSGWATAVTAADINPQGSLIVVRAYDRLLMYPRREGSSVEEALAASGCHGSRRSERQGESVAFASDGSHYLTVSEGHDVPVWRFPLAAAPRCGGVALRDAELQCPLADGSGCKVLADNMRGRTCRDYCARSGLGCVDGWEEQDETCEVKVEHGAPVELGCDRPYGTTSDLLCHCDPAPAGRP